MCVWGLRISRHPADIFLEFFVRFQLKKSKHSGYSNAISLYKHFGTILSGFLPKSQSRDGVTYEALIHAATLDDVFEARAPGPCYRKLPRISGIPDEARDIFIHGKSPHNAGLRNTCCVCRSWPTAQQFESLSRHTRGSRCFHTNKRLFIAVKCLYQQNIWQTNSLHTQIGERVRS